MVSSTTKGVGRQFASEIKREGGKMNFVVEEGMREFNDEEEESESCACMYGDGQCN